jgi:flagellar biosynthetic protein FlhB
LASSDSGEKTEKPTDKRIRDAREEGNVFQSQDLVTAAVLLIGVVMLQRLLPGIKKNVRQLFYQVLNLIPAQKSDVLSGSLYLTFVELAAKSVLPLLLVICGVSIIVQGAQTKFNRSTKVLKPKFERINPAAGIKRMFSLRGLMDLLKSLVKMAVLLWLVYLSIRDNLGKAIQLMGAPASGISEELISLIFSMVIRICAVFAVIAVADFAYQKWQYNKDLMMTKQEVKDEFKQMEGDPEIKGRIKKKQREIAQSRMMQAVPNADVVVRNPTHFAIALQYDPEKNAAPVVVAKGLDSLALRIVDVAQKSGVPCIENRPLAHALYAACEVGEQIPQEYYGTVAELLVYIYRQQGKEDKLRSRNSQ